MRGRLLGCALMLFAGVLLDALESRDEKAKEAWASKGAAFFQRRARKTVGSVGDKRTGDDEERVGAATG